MSYSSKLNISAEDAAAWTKLAQRLMLSEFDALQVDWNHLVPWGNDADSCKMSDSSGCLMPLSAGLGIVLGFGAFFSVFTTVLVRLESAFSGVTMTSEHYNTAGRDAGLGRGSHCTFGVPRPTVFR